MHKIKHYIDLIVEDGNEEYMECLSDMLCDTLYELKEYNYNHYKKYKCKLKGMAYNYKINEKLAKEIVEEMKPLGEYWNMDTIKSVIGDDVHGLANMYVVMNSLANDYSSVISLDDANTYVKMAHAWIDDADASENKIWKYFVEM